MCNCEIGRSIASGVTWVQDSLRYLQRGDGELRGLVNGRHPAILGDWGWHGHVHGRVDTVEDDQLAGICSSASCVRYSLTTGEADESARLHPLSSI